jgi:hypothetical protein
VSFVDNGQNVDPRGSCFYFAVGLFIGCAPVQQPNAQYFSTPAYDTETRIGGITKVHLHLKHSVPRGTVGVTLYDIDDQRWHAITYGIASLNLRSSDYEYELVDPGQPFRMTVEMITRDVVLPAGHRLGLAIGSQVGRYPLGLGGNGYAPVPSGGLTDILLGEATELEVSILPTAGTTLLPLP